MKKFFIVLSLSLCLFNAHSQEIFKKYGQYFTSEQAYFYNSDTDQHIASDLRFNSHSDDIVINGIFVYHNLGNAHSSTVIFIFNDGSEMVKYCSVDFLTNYGELDAGMTFCPLSLFEVEKLGSVSISHIIVKTEEASPQVVMAQSQNSLYFTKVIHQAQNREFTLLEDEPINE